MKKVIDRKVYDTEKAELLGEWDNGLGGNDFASLWEGLYFTKKGQHFIAGHGGAKTEYAQSNGREAWGGEDIRLVDEHQAIAWCEEHDLTDTIEEHFKELIEEG